MPTVTTSWQRDRGHTTGWEKPPTGRDKLELPSAKRLHNELQNHHYQWVNPLFLWPFSIAILTQPEGNQSTPNELYWLVVSTPSEKYESQLG